MMEDKGQIQSKEFDTEEHELRLYPIFLRDVCRLEEQIMELDAELAAIESGYGVSSQRIKGIEEAKYKDPPKVYVSDAPISMIMQKEKLTRRMRELTTELLYKEYFCRHIMKHIAVLSDEEREMIGYRYFGRMTLRQLGDLYLCDKNTMQRKLEKILAHFA